MRLFFSRDQLSHRPTQYGVHGRLVAPLENPDRAETLASTLTASGHTVEDPGTLDLAAIGKVHPEHYVQFLQTAFERFEALPNAGPEVIPNVHPYRSADGDLGMRPPPRTQGILGQTGWYIGDLSCAMTAGTFTAAAASAASAIAAAKAVGNGAGESYALCRPPGHHAYRDRANGFCFLNNAAIAAEVLRETHERVAILDFDTHHGDGTQSVFYTRPDVFVGSSHTDPTRYYPHFAGYAEERGHAEGEGFNLNLPLAEGSGDDAFITAAERLAEAAIAFGAGALVLSAGWDAHHADPLSKLKVTTDAYRTLGRLFGEMRLPTVIVQEGGYSLQAISEAAPAFIDAFVEGR